VIQQNASAAEQMSSTAEELSSQAEQLQSSIAFFDVGNSGARRAQPVRRAKSTPAKSIRPAAALPCKKTSRAGGISMDLDDDLQDESFMKY